MATMDIFEGDAFSIIELTRALEIDQRRQERRGHDALVAVKHQHLALQRQLHPGQTVGRGVEHVVRQREQPLPLSGEHAPNAAARRAAQAAAMEMNRTQKASPSTKATAKPAGKAGAKVVHVSTARAEHLGLGWVSLFEPADLHRLLALPEGAAPLGLLCIGPVDRFYQAPMLIQQQWRQPRPVSAVFTENAWDPSWNTGSCAAPEHLAQT